MVSYTMLHQQPMLIHVGYTHTHIYHGIAPQCVECIAEQSKCGATACHKYPQANMNLLIWTSSK